MKKTPLSPAQFGLPPRTQLERVDEQTIAIRIDRKSRIIMADGLKILDKITVLQQSLPDHLFALKTTAPVCGKTKTFLQQHGVTVIEV